MRRHTPFVFLLTALLLLFGTTRAFAECPGDNVRFYFGNGIISEPTEGAIKLAETLNSTISQGEHCDIEVANADNKSYGALADLCESAIQLGLIEPKTQDCLDAIEVLRPNIKGYADVLLLWATMANDVDTHWVAVEHKATLSALRRLFSNALDERPDRHIVLVSHSQGNLYANEVLLQLIQERGAQVLEHFAIVSVATPASDVIGGGDPRPHTTLKEDFIYRIPGALPYNVVDYPVEGACGLPWECHDFVKSYLVSPLAVSRIALKAHKASKLGDARINKVEPAKPEAMVGDRVLRIAAGQITVGGPSRTAVIVVLPDRTVSRLEKEQILSVSNSSLDVLLTLRDVGTYGIQLIDSSGARSNIFSFDVAGQSEGNRPPTASYTMGQPGVLASVPGADLYASAAPSTGSALVWFTDTSTDPDGLADIRSRRWTADTGCTPADPPPCLLSDGLGTFSWGFAPGRYGITLTVTDVAGHQASTLGHVIVSPGVGSSGDFEVVSQSEAIAHLTWQRSAESGAAIAASSGVGQEVAAALALPLDPAQTVFDNGQYASLANLQRLPAGAQWASWSQYYNPDGSCSRCYQARHFRSTFEIPVGYEHVASAALFDPAYADHGAIVPINDNLYVYVNGVLVARMGYSYGSSYVGPAATAPFASETDGWYANGWLTVPALSQLHAGVNTIDLVAEELAGSGGLGKLDLRLMYSQSTDMQPQPLNGLRGTGETVTNRAADNNWTLISGPTCGAGNCPAWASGGDDFSRSVVPNLDAVHPSGRYVFRTRILITPEELSTAHIAGRWATDDRGVDILVNGVSTALRSPRTFEFEAFDLTAGLVAGVNTLDFVVDNQDCPSCPLNPVSLRVEFRDRPRAGVWPVSGRDPQRSGRSEYRAPASAPTQPAWQFQTGAPVVGDLVVGHDQTVYAVSDDLYALRPDGSVLARGSSVIAGPFITGPGVDDTTGSVYVGRTIADGWEMVRFAADLSSATVVAAGTRGKPSTPIVDNGTAFFFTTGQFFAFGGQAYAVGQQNWMSNACDSTAGLLSGVVPYGWGYAPTIALDGAVLGVCSVIANGFSVGSVVLVKLDRVSGTVLRSARYGGAVELSVDGYGFARTGYFGFGGASYFGRYDRFDTDLNVVSGNVSYATSRTSYFSDTTSTIRRESSFFTGTVVTSAGSHPWSLLLPPGASTVPTTAQGEMVLVGAASQLVAVSGSDGTIAWTVPVTGNVTTQPVLAADGVIYVGTSSGAIYKLTGPPQLQ